MKVNDLIVIEADGRNISDVIDMLKRALTEHGDREISISDLSGSIVIEVEREEFPEEKVRRLSKELEYERSKKINQISSELVQQRIESIRKSYREWERNRLPNVD